jgi:hypothetical protein
MKKYKIHALIHNKMKTSSFRPAHLDYASFHLGVQLEPYNSKIKSNLKSKLSSVAFHFRIAWLIDYSHSIVAGGLEVTS